MLETYLEEIKEIISREEELTRKKSLEDAISAVKWRKEIEHFNDEKNLYEFKLAVDYVLNPPTQIRK